MKKNTRKPQVKAPVERPISGTTVANGSAAGVEASCYGGGVGASFIV